ncbi:hypothetical protein C8R43DRAFT_882677, partial [Mycena crocata]
MRDSPDFQTKMFNWLESIIKCELPSTNEVLIETDGAMKAPPLPEGKRDPRLNKDPRIDNMSEEEFEVAFRDTVEDLAILFNWHDHRATCWKHLKNGEPRTDESCRMRIDGSVNPFTRIDLETESIMLRRLHPRINNYNELIIFLLRCNMDIKYVGSGEAAKALIYYVTDYITKGTLATHVGLAALEYAIKKNSEKFDPEKPMFHDGEEVNRSLFTKTIMALMSKQEMSHQQVMSYLVGGGDCYSSHTFKIVKWGEYDRLMKKEEKMAKQVHVPAPTDSAQSVPAQDGEREIVPDDEEYTSEDEEEDIVHASNVEQLTIVVNENFVGIAANIQDYQFRSSDPVFESLSLWEHEEQVVKISKASEDRR